MLVVNFVQVGIAYRHFGGSDTVDETTAWAILFAATVVCVMAGAVAYWYVPTTHKGTFYEHRTFKRYVETWWWNEARHDVDHKGRECDQEGIRACLPTWVSIHYLHKDKCKELTSRTGGGGRRNRRSGSTRSLKSLCRGSCYRHMFARLGLRH